MNMSELETAAIAPQTYSVPEAGRILGLGKNASYEAARRGEIPVLRFGRKLRVPRKALERLLMGEGAVTNEI